MKQFESGSLFKAYSPIGAFSIALSILIITFPLLLYSQTVTNLSSRGGVISFEINVPPCHLDTLQSGEIRLSIRGFGTFSPPGAAALPGKVVRVAIPPIGEPVVSYRVLESEGLGVLELTRVKAERLIGGSDGMPVTEEYDVPDPWREGFTPDVIKTLAPSFMGRERVLPIRVIPVFRKNNTYQLARRIAVTVNTGGNARASLTENRNRYVSTRWKGLYKELLVNPSDVDKFALPLERVKPLLKQESAGKRLKIKIPETGLYTISADSLISRGLSPGLSIYSFALKKYYYDEGEPGLTRAVDIPYLVVEDPSSGKGIFDGKDQLIFYALGIKDDVAAGDTVALYTDYNVLWLEEDEAGKSMVQGPPLPSTSTGSVMSFTSRTIERKDTYYHKHPPIDSKDFYFLKGPTSEVSVLPFDCKSPATLGTFTLKIAIEGFEREDIVHNLTFSIENTNGEHQIGTGTIAHKDQKLFSFGPFPVFWLVDGTNNLVISADASYCYLVDHFIVDYSALFVAHDNFIDFNTVGYIEPRKVVISGFSVNSGVMIDVTDYLNPIYYQLTQDDFHEAAKANRRLANGERFVMSSASDTLKINIAAGPPRHFVVLGSGAESPVRLPSRMVQLDNPSALKEMQGPYQTLVIANKEFMNGIANYISWREAQPQNYRILTADVEDVFDEFNGGLPSSYAIKRFIRYGVDHWGVDFVLLVGDGNEDHKRVFIGNTSYQGTPPDYVPPFTFCAPTNGQYDDEVVAADNWYAFLDDLLPVSYTDSMVESVSGAETGQGYSSIGTFGGNFSSSSTKKGVPRSINEGSGVSISDAQSVRRSAGAYALPFAGDRYPDVFLGRISVGNDVEVRAIFTKIERFENVDINDRWRRRVVLFADDSWSGTGSNYMYHPYEIEFEESMDRVSQSIENSLPGAFDIRHCYLSHWTDGAHESQSESGPQVYSRVRDSVRTYFTPYLVKELNNSCLFFTFQGHANRSVLSTEAGFASFKQYDDLDSLRTYIPNIFIGIGCHISDFALVSELSRSPVDGPHGDCFSEQMLFKPGAGSVSTYASDGFEYLSENAFLCETLNDVIFNNPPNDSVPPDNKYTGAHWILGEMLTKAEIEQIDKTSYGLGQVIRYHLLGDPMLNIYSGPPLMKLEADWGGGWNEVQEGDFHATDGSNHAKLRFTASDVVALGVVKAEINGVDISDSLTIEAPVDTDKTYSREYTAEMGYNFSLDDESLVFKVLSPRGEEVGKMEFDASTNIRLFYNDNFEITPGVESPPEGIFKLIAVFPAYLPHAPELMVDSLKYNDSKFYVPDPNDSLHWEIKFPQTFSAGRHVLTVKVDEHAWNFDFVVTGNELVAQTFCFPNPFRDGTNIVYVLNLPADSGTLRIYNVSGTLIRSFELDRDMLDAANFGLPHSLYWDGRDSVGDRVANGTYIYLLHFVKGGKTVEITGKSVRLR